jgi:hypothetical protein
MRRVNRHVLLIVARKWLTVARKWLIVARKWLVWALKWLILASKWTHIKEFKYALCWGQSTKHAPHESSRVADCGA